MGFGIHVGVHTNSYWCLNAQLSRNLGNDLHLRLALYIELTDATCQRHAHFFTRFADTGKNNAFARHTRCLRARVFSARHNIHASP